MCANPQKENGFTPIANEILEALSRTVLSSYEHQLIPIIFRNTYGYKRKIWKLKKWKNLEDLTGIKNTHINRTLGKLIEKKIIEVNWNEKEILFLKNYEQWIGYKPPKKVTQIGNISRNKKLPKQVTKKLPKQVTQVTQIGNSTLSEPALPLTLPDPKENLKKDLKETSLSNNVLNTSNSKEVAVLEKKEEDVSKSSQERNLEWVNSQFGEDHCKKYPDDSKRKEILEIYKRGCCSLTIKNTILHWKQEIEYPSKLDEFVLNSLKAQMKKGRSFYD